MASVESFTLLSLPSDVRLRILAYTQLVRPCPIEPETEKCRFRGYYTASGRHRYPGPSIRDCEYSGCTPCWLAKVRACPSDPMNRHRQLNERCHCPSIPLALLYVCRTLRDEAEQVLYGLNSFRMAFKSRRTFKAFHRLRPQAIGAIRRLHVRLNNLDWINRPRNSPLLKYDFISRRYFLHGPPFAGTTDTRTTLLKQ